MIDLEELILKVQEYVDSPKFLSMSEEQKENFIRFGIPLMVGVFAGIEMLDYVAKTCELKELNKEIDVAKLEKLWGVKK